MSARSRSLSGWLAALALGVAFQVAAAGSDAPAQAAGSSSGVDLELKISVQKFPRGALMVAIFDSEAAYSAGAKPVKALKLEVTGASVQAVVHDLAAGQYGIKMFHDLDGTGKLTTNLFGVPTEPVAFSNNAKVNMRAPTWDEAAFNVAPGGNVQAIDID